MSAPVITPRPTPTRPTSPVRRAAPPRPAARPTTARSTTGRSATARGATNASVPAARSATGKPATGKPATGKSGTGKPATGKTATGKTSTARTSTARTSTARTSTARTSTARGASVRAGGSRAAAAVQGSSALALQAPERVSQGATRVRVVERPELGARRIGFAVSCTAVLGALMLGLLLLNVAISGNAFTIADLQSQRSLLVDQQQSLEQQLLLANAPASLADRARALGMVPAGQVLVLESDGTGAAPVPAAP